LPGPRSRQHGRLAQCERVAARRHAEHAPVLAAELRGAVVADREADTGDVPRLGEEPRPRLVQADLLWNWIGVIEVTARKWRWNDETLIVASAASSSTRSVSS
jgi:hypothetical protein